MFFNDIVFDFKDTLDNKLFDVEDGFMHGNMFKDTYKPYKNYKVVDLNSYDEKSNLILKIYAYDFALNDLALYLDLNPQDNNMYMLFKKYSEEIDSYIKSYEKKYGPLEICDSDYDTYLWEKGPWPFNGGIM